MAKKKLNTNGTFALDVERSTGANANLLYKTAVAINKGVPKNIAFAWACEDENFDGNRKDIKKDRLLARKALKKHYGIDIDQDLFSSKKVKRKQLSEFLSKASKIMDEG